MRLRNVKNKEDILNNCPYLIKNPESYKGKWSNLFDNNNPIYIEIGMGKGKFILENAIKNPNIFNPSDASFWPPKLKNLLVKIRASYIITVPIVAITTPTTNNITCHIKITSYF